MSTYPRPKVVWGGEGGKLKKQKESGNGLVGEPAITPASTEQKITTSLQKKHSDNQVKERFLGFRRKRKTTRFVEKTEPKPQMHLSDKVNQEENLLYLSSSALRDPLTSIQGHIDLTKERLRREGHQKASEQLARLAPSLKRLERLMDNLFDLGNLESGEFVLRKEKVFLPHLFEKLQKEEEVFREVFYLEVAQNLPPVLGDTIQLVKTFYQFLLYSTRFAVKGKKILIKIFQETKHVMVSFFDPARCADLEASDQAFGQKLGLGGQLALRLIDLHGGKFLRSASMQTHSFSICLPIA